MPRQDSEDFREMSKNKRASDLPVMHCFLSCDGVSSEPSGKRSLHGLFDQIFATEFPTQFKPFALFVRLMGGSGKHAVTIQGTGTDEKLVGTHKSIDSKFKPTMGAEVVVQISPLSLLKPGVVRFVVNIDGKPIGWPCEITVGKLPTIGKSLKSKP